MIHRTVELAVKKDQVSMKCFELKSYFAEIARAIFYDGDILLDSRRVGAYIYGDENFTMSHVHCDIVQV